MTRMTNSLQEKLKEKQVEYILQTDEYKVLLEEMCEEISRDVLVANNEASVVSIIELNLFSFMDKVLGVKFYPEKEKAINTERHIAKGRIDSKIGALIIEYKFHDRLKTKKEREKASEQIITYMEGVLSDSDNELLGVVMDGTQCKFIRMSKNELIEESFETLKSCHLDRIIKSIILLNKVALNSRNLILDFCESDDNSFAHKMAQCLYNTLKNEPTGRSKMLFNEWKELFRLAHDDTSKQRTIEDRKKSLEIALHEKIKDKEDEYLALYAIQTSYAIIVKIIAYKVISKIRFNKSLIDFNVVAEANADALRLQMNALEEGAIFRDLGIGNLLEGDFFAWYSTVEQWNDEIADYIKKVFQILTKYEDKAVFEKGDNVTDLFKDLFLKIIPDKVRSSLGEYYTPSWLADSLISQASGLLEKKSATWKALDPCAGAGTFLTVLIKMVLEETSHLTREQRLFSVLERVKGIDLNPLAVLTARINYFINISPLISENDVFEIPVYLGDASYVPERKFIDNIECLSYTINTLKGEIDITIPSSMVSNTSLFYKTITNVEDDIKNLDSHGVSEKLWNLVSDSDRTEQVRGEIVKLADQFVELEKNNWNGIWARIVANFLTTANLGKFDLIVGNPPWIDWKNLPEGYRERIKSICVERHLFSGDGMTGGINLNVCALISNVSAQNWLAEDGVLAFLMPTTLTFQQTYEGFRNFTLDGTDRLYLQQLIDWKYGGNPFFPVTQKFSSYFFSRKKVDYSLGVPLYFYHKNNKIPLDKYKNTSDFWILLTEDAYRIERAVAGQIDERKTAFSYGKNSKELEGFKNISGESYYRGREGIEFYPQELFLLEYLSKVDEKHVFVQNFQSGRSKYTIPREQLMLENKFLHPLVKGVDIKRFHLKQKNEYLVPFPYEIENKRSPISKIELTKQSKLLARYFMRHKNVLQSQSEYTKKIIGDKHDNEFYALARVGEYSFAEYFVAYRDNTSWGAVVISTLETPWGEAKRPQFQNHAVTITQNDDGGFISKEEAHFICGVLNAPIVESYILNSSDARSFKIRPPLHIPKYESSNIYHTKLASLSMDAHLHWADKKKMRIIDEKLDELVLLLR